MKRKWIRLLVLFVLIIFGMQSVKVKAEVVITDGESTISGSDIIGKMSMSGKAKVIPGGTIPTYQLADFTGYHEAGTVGAIWLEDRLSTSDPFHFEGYISAEQGKKSDDDFGDGMSVIFHSDSTSQGFVGNPGEYLGVLPLKNAYGLVLDTHMNESLKQSDWQTKEDLKEPTGKATYYSQIWTTNEDGKGHREGKPDLGVKKELRDSPKRKVIVNYDENRNLTIQLEKKTVGDFTTYQFSVPTKIKYMYFASTASTGWASGDYKIYLEKITYTAYRNRELRYRDVDTGEFLVGIPNVVSDMGKVDGYYNMTDKVKIPEGYDVTGIEGELSGVYSYDEKLEDRFITIDVKKQSTKNSFDTTTVVNTVLRTDHTNMTLTPPDSTKNKNLISFNKSNSPIHPLTSASISITTPKDVSVSKESLPKNWNKVVYQTNTKTTTQYFNTEVSELGTSDFNLDENGVNTFLKGLNLTVDSAALDKDETLLNNTNIIVSTSSRPIIYWENKYETVRKSLLMVSQRDINKKAGQVKPITYKTASDSSKAFAYRYKWGAQGNWQAGYGNGQANSTNGRLVHYGTENDVDENFLKMATKGLTEPVWVDGNKALSGGNLISESDVPNKKTSKFLVEFYSEKSVQAGVDETAVTPFAIPQPLYLLFKDTQGNMIQDKKVLPSVPYRLGDTALAKLTDIPSITDYTYKGTEEKVSLPVVSKKELQKVTALYERNNVTMTVKYLLNGTKNPIYSDLDNGTTKKVDVYNKIITGKKIVDVLNDLVKTSQLSLKYEGYLPLNTTDYIVEGSNPKLENVPTNDFTVIFNYTGTVSMRNVSDIDFGEIKMSDDESIKYKPVSNKEQSIAITNTTNEKGWELTSQIVDPIRNSENSKELYQGDLVLTNKKGNEYVITETSQEVYDSSQSSDRLVTKISLNDTMHLTQKMGNEIGAYEGDILWSVVEGP